MTAPALLSSLELARVTHTLHLNSVGLRAIPPAVFGITDLVRLDLGNNEISELPDEIGNLTSLEELWLNDNVRLRVIPTAIEACRRLRVIDLRNTMVYKVPKEVNRLPRLVELDLRGTRLKPKITSAASGGTADLINHLRYRDERKQLKIRLTDMLTVHVYTELADTPAGKAEIRRLVKDVFATFTDFKELGTLIRNAERLFPPDLWTADVHHIRARFDELRRDNERKRLGAELELKLRAIYFDRIDPTEVEGIVNSINKHVTTLKDLKFLLFYATQLFPEELKDLDAATLYKDLLALRQRFAEERAAAIAVLHKALSAMYADREPAEVEKVTKSVASQIKKVEDLKSLAADASDLFPAEFTSVRAGLVVEAFRAKQLEKAGADL